MRFQCLTCDAGSHWAWEAACERCATSRLAIWPEWLLELRGFVLVCLWLVVDPDEASAWLDSWKET